MHIIAENNKMKWQQLKLIADKGVEYQTKNILALKIFQILQKAAGK